MFCPFCGQYVENTYIYCPFCGREIPEVENSENAAEIPVNGEQENEVRQVLENQSEDELITYYFRQGFVYQKILLFLSTYHGIEISLRTLSTRLRSLGLRRRNVEFDVNRVSQRIQEEIDGPGNSGGYRCIAHTLQMEGLQVPRESVRILIKELDPEGVNLRRSRTLRRRTYHSPGPNFVWHVDGYDKIKPYGFPVHGCIDGYSRKVLWLKVCKTNNDPAVTGKHFLDAISKYGGCPMLLRTDNGTENILMAGMQAYFRSSGEDHLAGCKAHRYGSSPANQRIECWWSFLRKNRSNWWINFFKDLVETGDLDTSNDMQKECLWYCFSGLLQQDFNTVKQHWNTHYIRKSRFETVEGRPDELYYLPECAGATDHLRTVSDAQFNEMSQYCHEYEENSIIQEYFQNIGEQMGLSQATNWRQALEMYHNLCEIALG